MNHSNLDPTRSCLRHTQILHLRPCSSDRGNPPESSEDHARLGLEYWQIIEAEVALLDLCLLRTSAM
jgi:hypothetical protein